MRPAIVIATATLIAAGYLWWARRDVGVPSLVLDVGFGDGEGSTAGDLESNFVYDAVDTMKSVIVGWPTGSEPYQALIEQSAQANAIPVQILAWLFWKESRYNPAIISGAKRSPVGAMGIGQFMPATAREELGSVEAALDPAKAIPGAARYLAKLYRQTGSWREALAAYNWGIGNVRKKGIDNAPAETLDYYTTILSRAGYDPAFA